ncbi:MAG: family 78 glycoside hydrolase catalytic domain [Lachnospiraceae bacterium]|nr:family 78 glycoside hydrolase catalytic domain [Lachnospiraceae bacterium]
MLKISRFTVENLAKDCITDNKAPVFAFSTESDRPGAQLKAASITVGGWTKETAQQTGIRYDGPALAPFTAYTAELTVQDDAGESASACVGFRTGRLDTPWQGIWISDAAYQFTEKGVSPVPMTFRKQLSLSGKVKKAEILATAMGIYELYIDKKRVGDRYFAPGFTSYKTNLMYQTLDVTEALSGKAPVLEAVVAGGWAVGSFVFTRGNRAIHDRQALLLEVRVTYDDGRSEVIGTDETWEVTEDGPVKMADFYDGETYDAAADPASFVWRSAAAETLKIRPQILAEYGSPVLPHEVFQPKSCKKVGDAFIYDFGQNFAGVVNLKINGKKGQTVTVKHAEILNRDGSLNLSFLRSAKATLTYLCKDGLQCYSPRFTYMGFRYISIEGIDAKDVEVTATAIYSDLEQIGSFACSDPLLNQLQSNIVWGAKSNLVDIPTDCPQRDERMGWTGDIHVFGPTACFNFDMSRFLDKWLKDMRAEQFPGGGIPNTVPRQGYGFPTTMPDMAVDWWDDACIMVPWALYQAYGDEEVLRINYRMMKKYIKAELFWAGLLSFGKRRYIWNTPGIFHFGDWVAPDVPQMGQWQARAKWTGTASIKNCAATVAKIAQILGEEEDRKYYSGLAEKVSDAYCSVLTDGNGKLLGSEFQTAYVLPIYLEMFPNEEIREKAVQNLIRLVEAGDYCIGTGFPGTPYILFALCDTGHADVAFKMLMNTKCPSWLYEVRVGATTIWERWDGLDENGECPIGDSGTADVMISYNHYAAGAVGAFLYRRIAGLEMTAPGYKTFRIRPIPGGGLTGAEASVITPYGKAASSWKTENGSFVLTAQVPMGTWCEVVLPDGSSRMAESGTHTFRCKL